MTTAVVVEVMESWPLGLRIRVEGEADERFVDLAEDCEIVRRGVPADVAALQPGLRIELALACAGVVGRLEILG